MFDRIVNFVCAVAFNGLLALLFTGVICLIGAIILPFVGIPIEIIIGKAVKDGLFDAAASSMTFRILYTIIFLTMMVKEYRTVLSGMKRGWSISIHIGGKNDKAVKDAE